MREVIIQLLKKSLKEAGAKLKEEEIGKFIEIPKNYEMGDYAFPCFFLVNRLKQEPDQIAIEIRKNIGDLPRELEDIQTVGPYINFFVNRKEFAINLVKEILRKKEKFGKSVVGKGTRTMVEFPSPNTNKPLHVGHLRNMSLGESVSRILEFSGEKVIRANLNNDRGIHICKSMLAYQKFGKNKEPEKVKSDHFVGDFYVMFNKKSKTNKTLEIQAHDLLRKWEEGDKETRKLWKKMNKWALDGFKKTYKRFGIAFDKEYYESEIYTKGKEIILEGVKKGIFQKKEEGVTVNITKPKLGKKFLLRPDGTSVYMTQDIYLAKLKSDQFKLNKSIYVTGNEQEYHFKILFLLLKKLNFDFSDNLYHLSHGMVNFPHGKMKSREGQVADADDLIDSVQKLVKKELKSRNKLSKKQLESRSLKIALAAIKYFLLKVDIKKNMLFDPKKSMNFEGDTGSYLLYSYARASSILRKAKIEKKKFNISKLELKEIELVKKLSQFPEIVLASYKNLNPSLISNYSYQIAQTFNEFYHACPVIGSEQESFRLELVEAFRQILKNSLNLLGIETLEEM